jgi:hypothetical protein
VDYFLTIRVTISFSRTLLHGISYTGNGGNAPTCLNLEVNGEQSAHGAAALVLQKGLSVLIGKEGGVN